MDTPSTLPTPRPRGRVSAPEPLPPNTLAAPLVADSTRDERVKEAAEMLLGGARADIVAGHLADRYGITVAQARRDLADVRTYAQHVLGSEDAIAGFVLTKLGELQQVSQRLLEDATEEAPELVYDADSQVVTEASLETRTKGKQQVAASARAFADISKVQFSVIGARSRHYSARAREGAESEDVSPDQKKALDAFWSDE